MSDDKMRQEFEAWAKSEGFDLSRWIRVGDDGKLTPTEYADAETRAAEKAYQAGQKAERAELERLERAALDRLRAELRAAKFGRTSRKQKDKTPPPKT